MIKTHTNPELLNDLRKLCKGVKEIRIIFHTNEENDFDYSDVIEFLDADGNYIDEDELNDAYDSLFEFDYSDPYELKQVSINWRLYEYLEDLLDASGIHLCQIWWQGAFILDLDNIQLSCEEIKWNVTIKLKHVFPIVEKIKRPASIRNAGRGLNVTNI